MQELFGLHVYCSVARDLLRVSLIICVLPLQPHSSPGLDQDLHSLQTESTQLVTHTRSYLEYVVVDDRSEVLLVRHRVPAPVQDSHLFENGTLSGFAGAQQQNLDAILHKLLLSAQIPVNSFAAGTSLPLLGGQKAESHTDKLTSENQSKN